MKVKEKLKAISLRKKGYSIKEISRSLSVAKSSVSLWVRNVKLNETAKQRLLSRIKLGQYNSGEKKKALKDLVNIRLKEAILSEYRNVKLSKATQKLLCAFIYWCEGAKDDGGIAFTNSDPYLTNFFLKLLIEAYGAEKKKFVARLHMHKYHNIKKQEKFWQDILGLKPSQFRKAYLKPNTSKRYRENYPGCISLRYYDSILARKLMFLAQAFTGSVVQR